MGSWANEAPVGSWAGLFHASVFPDATYKRENWTPQLYTPPPSPAHLAPHSTKHTATSPPPPPAGAVDCLMGFLSRHPRMDNLLSILAPGLKIIKESLHEVQGGRGLVC